MAGAPLCALRTTFPLTGLTATGKRTDEIKYGKARGNAAALFNEKGRKRGLVSPPLGLTQTGPYN
jgi:hypothetical protein